MVELKRGQIVNFGSCHVADTSGLSSPIKTAGTDSEFHQSFIVDLLQVIGFSVPTNSFINWIFLSGKEDDKTRHNPDDPA